MGNLRVRFAPSPTGYMHLGNARTALFNYLFARKNKATLVLRIEDTDAERSTEEAVNVIVDSMKWLGIDWDEGYFGKGSEKGEKGPYTQMERLSIYSKHVDKLLAEKKAYYCFCTEEEIEEKRQEAMKKGRPYRYDRKCLGLQPEEISKLKKEKRFAVRFKIEGESVEFDDSIRGKVSFQTKEIGDFVIARSDGVPVYNFCVVVDDFLMGITNVIRGEDHLSNTPRQVLLYKAFGFEIPKFAHLPMILGADRSKLSKRHGETSLLAYRDKGYLPAAMFNYMALLGWYPKDGVEIKPKEKLIEDFDISAVGHSGSIFDEKKLTWMNAEYIKKLSVDEIYSLSLPHLKDVDLKGKDEAWIKRALEAVRTGINFFAEVPGLLKLFITAEEPSEENKKLVSTGSAKKVLLALKEELSKAEITKNNFKAMLNETAKKAGVKGKDLYMPVRIALTGIEHGPELVSLLPVIGSAECIKRIDKYLV